MGKIKELDSMPPGDIKSIVADSISGHIDPHEWQLIQQIEKQERETLRQVAQSFRRAA